MTGKELVELIVKYNLEDKVVSADLDGIVFKMAEVQNPTDDSDLRCIYLVVDSETGKMSLGTF